MPMIFCTANLTSRLSALYRIHSRMGPVEKLRRRYAPKLSLLLAVNHETEIEATKARATVTAPTWLLWSVRGQ